MAHQVNECVFPNFASMDRLNPRDLEAQRYYDNLRRLALIRNELRRSGQGASAASLLIPPPRAPFESAFPHRNISPLVIEAGPRSVQEVRSQGWGAASDEEAQSANRSASNQQQVARHRTRVVTGNGHRDSYDADHRVGIARNPSTAREVALSNLWEEMYQRLVLYKQEHGDCLVPNRYKPDKQLGSWVSTQRRNYCKGKGMSPDRIDRLEALGFVWRTTDPRATPWMERFKQLAAFYEEHGHSVVPVMYGPNKPLANWVSAQRQEYRYLVEDKPSRITAERIKLLNTLDFMWDALRHRKPAEIEEEKNTKGGVSRKRKQSPITTDEDPRSDQEETTLKQRLIDGGRKEDEREIMEAAAALESSSTKKKTRRESSAVPIQVESATLLDASAPEDRVGRILQLQGQQQPTATVGGPGLNASLLAAMIPGTSDAARLHVTPGGAYTNALSRVLQQHHHDPVLAALMPGIAGIQGSPEADLAVALGQRRLSDPVGVAPHLPFDASLLQNPSLLEEWLQQNGGHGRK